MADKRLTYWQPIETDKVLSLLDIASENLGKKGRRSFRSLIKLNLLMVRIAGAQLEECDKSHIDLATVERQYAVAQRRLRRLKPKQQKRVRRAMTRFVAGVAAMMLSMRHIKRRTTSNPNSSRNYLLLQMSHLRPFFDLDPCLHGTGLSSDSIMRSIAGLNAGEAMFPFKPGIRSGREVQSYTANCLRYEMIALYPYMILHGLSKTDAQALIVKEAKVQFTSAQQWPDRTLKSIGRWTRTLIDRNLRDEFGDGTPRSADRVKKHFSALVDRYRVALKNGA